jgi:hypothetical protein
VDKEQEHRGLLGNILLFPDGEADSSTGHHARFHRSNLAYNISDFVGIIAFTSFRSRDLMSCDSTSLD